MSSCIIVYIDDYHKSHIVKNKLVENSRKDFIIIIFFEFVDDIIFVSDIFNYSVNFS